MRRRIRLCVLLLTVTGCAKDDPEKLRAIGQAGANQIQQMAPEKIPGLALGKERKADSTPQSHVQSRLQNDKYLHRFGIEVTPIEKGVKLTGRVPTKEHANRATELAESTRGIERVDNEIVVE